MTPPAFGLYGASLPGQQSTVITILTQVTWAPDVWFRGSVR